MEAQARPIGVFDSGLGGISVLRACVRLLPQENFLFFGDSANAPYGEKSLDQVRALTLSAVDRLLAQGVKGIVVACNTATSVAAAPLRAELSLPIIGMEPALKPASELRHGGRILVMATPLTLRLPKFQALMERYGEGASPLPCPGLMELVEEGELDGPEVRNYLSALLQPYRDAPLDAVVLGCTHYVFLRPVLRRMLPPETALLDGNAGTVRQLHRVLEQRGLCREAPSPGRVELLTSGDPLHILPQMERLLHLPDMDETAR